MYDKLLSPQWIFDRCIEVTLLLALLLLVDLGLNVLIFVVTRESTLATRVTRLHSLRRILGYFVMLVIGVLSFRAFVLDILDIVIRLDLGTFDRRESIAIVWAGAGTIILWKLYRRIHRAKRKLLTTSAAVVFGIIYLVPVAVFIVSYTGYSICSAGRQFWRAIIAAHPIHGQLKIDVMEGRELPKSHNEFVARVDPALFETIRKNAKTLYLYDASTNTFTWFVRPSRYYVVVFDSRQDYKLYRLSMAPSFFNVPYFPPFYEGPWDQLPR